MTAEGVQAALQPQLVPFLPRVAGIVGFPTLSMKMLDTNENTEAEVETPVVCDS